MKKKEKDLLIKLVKEKRSDVVITQHELLKAGELTAERSNKIDKELKELSDLLVSLTIGV
ncbi:hypothetical protein NNG48_07050 [Enterococcus faecium]|nr:hypothetical protein [Enterococcus faecium]